ncbi:hypothetical protein AGOR_G00107340 [Albula goreensis]|uniref:Uncharacterized protein n=1 Tax=Albula goreensis TaxID=1534307 RepID=A0A8T3DI69_9TELE|nr:hypothetical protein AGOR_G00107340 [Albula goreensis]
MDTPAQQSPEPDPDVFWQISPREKQTSALSLLASLIGQYALFKSNSETSPRRSTNHPRFRQSSTLKTLDKIIISPQLHPGKLVYTST